MAPQAMAGQWLSRITTVVGYARYVSNTPIAIAAKVLVQLKNLFRLKGSLGQYLNDANTLQHLSELTQVCSSPVRSNPVPNADPNT